MRKIFFVFALIATFAMPAAAQATTHAATLTWQDTLNPATGTTYSVYRAPGLCSGSPVFAKIATAVAAKTYVDSTVTPGNYCYAVTATVGGVESAQSTPGAAAVPAFAVTSLSVTVT